MCYSNFVPKKCVVFEILRYSTSNNVIALKSGSVNINKVVPLDRLGTVSCWCSLVNLSLKRTAFEVFDFEKCCDLEIRVTVTQGHRNRHGSIRLYDFLLTLHSDHGRWAYLAPFPKQTAISVENCKFFSPPCF